VGNVKKGAISIETIAILVIVMIVLLVLIAFFMGVFGPGRSSIELQRKFYGECGKWTAAGCVSDISSTNLVSDCSGWQGVDEADIGTEEDDTCSGLWIENACGCPK